MTSQVLAGQPFVMGEFVDGGFRYQTYALTGYAQAKHKGNEGSSRRYVFQTPPIGATLEDDALASIHFHGERDERGYIVEIDYLKAERIAIGVEEGFEIEFGTLHNRTIWLLPIVYTLYFKRKIGADLPAQTSDVTGTIVAYAAQDAPEGWALCDGTLYNRLDPKYAELFRIIGTRFGGGPNDFAVPDLRGRVIVMSGNGLNLTPRSLGEIFGDETVRLTEDQMPIHSHGINANETGQGWRGVDEGGGAQHVTTEDAGGGQPHPNVQPSLALNYIIKL
jgi:microcystin-dependent protein